LIAIRMQTLSGSIRFSLSVAVTVFLCYYARLLLLPGFSLLQDPDVFWHIRTGQWILDHAEFPTVDVFSHTASGKAWIPTEWLSEVLLALVYRSGGWRALVILTAASGAAVIAIVCYHLLRHLRFSVAVGWSALTAVAITPHFLARPHIFSYVVLALWLVKLLDAYDESEHGRLPSLRALVPLMVIWANLHGSFTFGLVLLYIFAGILFWQGLRRRDRAACRDIVLNVGIVSLSSLATPYGVFAAFMTLELLDLKFTIPRIVELRAPDFQEHRAHLFLFVGLLAAIAATGARLKGARLIVFALILFTGLSYLRGLVMFFLLAPLLFARPMSETFPWLRTQLSGKSAADAGTASDPVFEFFRRRPVAVPAFCMAFGALATLSLLWRNDVLPPKRMAPQAALDFARSAKIAGNVFNSYSFGGFLLFSDVPTFVDGRALPFGDALLRRYFETVNLVDIDAAFRTLDEYEISWAILNPAEPLTKALSQSPHWNSAYADNYAVVFTRRP
jgi:hypothetical protein